MKKLIAILLSIFIVLSLSACNDDDKGRDDTNLEFGDDGEINFPIIDA